MNFQAISAIILWLCIGAPLIAGIWGLIGLWGARQGVFDPLHKSRTGEDPVDRYSCLWKWGLTLASVVSLMGTVVLIARANQLPISGNLLVPYYVDTLSAYFMLLIDVVAVFASWYLERSQPADPDLMGGRNREVFRTMFGLFQGSLLLIPVLDDLFAQWLLIELTTAISVILLLRSNGSHAAEAGVKYLFITIPPLIFAFLGLTLIAVELPAGVAFSWSTLMHHTNLLNPPLLSLAFVGILLGYGAKAGLAPLHTWLPDVHGEAPAAMSSMLSSVMVKMALLAILRWASIVNRTLGSSIFTNSLFLGFAIASLIVATLAILKHNHFKRVLAWHTLEHMGIIMFGLGIGTPLAIFGALLHTFNHALTKELTFLAFGNVRAQYWQANGQTNEPVPALAGMSQPSAAVRLREARPRRRMAVPAILRSRHFSEDDITGALKATPLSGGLLALGGLSLVGSPPFNIFLSEVIILWAALEQLTQGASGLVIVATVVFIASITCVFGGLISHLAKILLDRAPETLNTAVLTDTFSRVWPLAILFALIVVFGITIPTIGPLNIPRIIHQSACIVQGENGPC